MGQIATDNDIYDKRIKDIIERLEALCAEGKINDIRYQDSKEGRYRFKVKFNRDDGTPIEICTDGEKRYRTIFEPMIEEFTDYVAPNDSFKSLVDWMFRFVSAYVNYEYSLIVYKDRLNIVVAKEMVFNNKNLGRKSIGGGMTVSFWMYKWLGKYKKEIVRPKHHVKQDMNM